MNEILMELRILEEIMNESQRNLKKKLDSDEGYFKDTSFLEEKMTFGKIIYTITKDLSKETLKSMSNKEMIEHIQKIQVIEKD